MNIGVSDDAQDYGRVHNIPHMPNYIPEGEDIATTVVKDPVSGNFNSSKSIFHAA